MKKISMYASLVCAILWFACCILAIFVNDFQFKTLYILSSATLTIMFITDFIKEKHDARQIERTDDESRQESECNNNIAG